MPKSAKPSPGVLLRKPFEDEINRCKNAITTNPNDPTFYAYLAHAYIVLWCYGFIPHAEALPPATEAVEKALAIDPECGMAHTVLGLIRESHWQWDAIESELKLGIQFAPDDALAHNWYANYLYANSRFAEAYIMAETAVTLSSDPGLKIGLGAISYFTQDFERLKREMLAVIADHPDYAPAYDWLGMAYIQLQEFDKSIEAYETAAKLSGRLAEILGGLGHAYGIAGREADARNILNEMKEYAESVHVPPVQIAFVYAGLGDDNNTIAMLERAFAEKSWELIFIRTEPWFEHLHDDPRFQRIVERMNFLPLG